MLGAVLYLSSKREVKFKALWCKLQSHKGFAWHPSSFRALGLHLFNEILSQQPLWKVGNAMSPIICCSDFIDCFFHLREEFFKDVTRMTTVKGAQVNNNALDALAHEGIQWSWRIKGHFLIDCLYNASSWILSSCIWCRTVGKMAAENWQLECSGSARLVFWRCSQIQLWQVYLSYDLQMEYISSPPRTSNSCEGRWLDWKCPPSVLSKYLMRTCMVSQTKKSAWEWLFRIAAHMGCSLIFFSLCFIVSFKAPTWLNRNHISVLVKHITYHSLLVCDEPEAIC